MAEPDYTRLPREHVACLPTPLHPALRLSAEVGVEVWLKRDDLTGIGMGGNKVRILEFLLGDGLRRGCDVLVTGSGPQSNWSFLAALAAGRCGLDTVLCFYGDEPREKRGNLLLHAFTRASITYTGNKERSSVDNMIERTADRLTREGRHPLVLPRGGATALGSVGYVLCAEEIRDQSATHGLDRPTVWLATGSCGTQAGLVVGVGLGWLGRAVGVTVSRPGLEARSRVYELACGSAELLGVPAPRDVGVEVLDGWIADGYGIPSSEGRAAAALVARTEGVLLDPAFGAKAMAALIEAARSGAQTDPVVFLVSGGAPTLFAHGSTL